MPFAYYVRLTGEQKRIYRKSDEIHAISLPSGAPFDAMVAQLAEALKREHRKDTEGASQALLDEIIRRLAVPPVRVKVYAARPHIQGGELHGLYEPSEDHAPAVISVWMRTARRRQVVAFRSFLRTLLHELCHHLDYEFLELPETFHTEGFYKRESSLFYQVHGDAGKSGQSQPTGEGKR